MPNHLVHVPDELSAVSISVLTQGEVPEIQVMHTDGATKGIDPRAAMSMSILWNN